MKNLFLIPIFALMIISIVPAFASEPTLPETPPTELPLLSQRTTVDIHGEQYYLYYTLTNGTLNGVEADLDFISLVFDLDVTADSALFIGLERVIFGSEFKGNDDNFILLIDGDEPNFTEIITTSTNRILEIEIPAGSDELEIIGSYFISDTEEKNEKRIDKISERIVRIAEKITEFSDPNLDEIRYDMIEQLQELIEAIQEEDFDEISDIQEELEELKSELREMIRNR